MESFSATITEYPGLKYDSTEPMRCPREVKYDLEENMALSPQDYVKFAFLVHYH